ncbi:MAG TPA: elongation factor P maturation arginine rhamnosyltransferase EarP [Burkholderiales bacterium]|nr:elongation factor P maturation arginine rhamnosyltransferase EarP [Burkholderiales bacterium]
MQRWDIFCAVIDNYGDAAVSWRLARQLAEEHDIAVRLWINDLRPLSALCPEIDAALVRQTCRKVEVRWWPEDFPAVEPADTVIETFACELPDAYLAAMAAAEPMPRWINLEYLSAENWVRGCHRLPSPHPRLHLPKHFFFPGFLPDTGGLLRETDLLERRRAFQASAGQQTAFWRELGCEPAVPALKVSLFGYENPALEDLLQAWSDNPTPIWCALPQSRLSASIAARFGAAEVWQSGNLTLQRLPFLDTERYDRLLWACDLNFIRGEDSFVRALWAGRPLVWHIYPQDAAAHHDKLHAFLDLYQLGLDAENTAVLRAFWQAWNGIGERPLSWKAWQNSQPALARHHETWLERLTAQTDLTANLVKFASIG